MDPKDIAKTISEDISYNNGIDISGQILLLLEAVSYIELTHVATKLPQGEADAEAAENLINVLNDVAGFVNLIQAQTGEKPKHVDDLFKAYGNMLAKLGIKLAVNPRELKMDLDQAKPYFVGMLRRLAQVTGNLSARSKFKDIKDKSEFSKFVNMLGERIMDTIK
jgi:hypothetical protein